jgi:hypothetical protein
LEFTVKPWSPYFEFQIHGFLTKARLPRRPVLFSYSPQSQWLRAPADWAESELCVLLSANVLDILDLCLTVGGFGHATTGIRCRVSRNLPQVIFTIFRKKIKKILTVFSQWFPAKSMGKSWYDLSSGAYFENCLT